MHHSSAWSVFHYRWLCNYYHPTVEHCTNVLHHPPNLSQEVVSARHIGVTMDHSKQKHRVASTVFPSNFGGFGFQPVLNLVKRASPTRGLTWCRWLSIVYQPGMKHVLVETLSIRSHYSPKSHVVGMFLAWAVWTSLFLKYCTNQKNLHIIREKYCCMQTRT